ncbi:MAG: hypothetical protein FJX36_14520 [Alphaproteobacteria bacterium]|nr:hypothetical protein [Alphaproteobacteria bacterium]
MQRAGARSPDQAQRPGGWSLARWWQEHKVAFMELARLWMSLYGRVTVAEAEALWDELKLEQGGASAAAQIRARLGN